MPTIPVTPRVLTGLEPGLPRLGVRQLDAVEPRVETGPVAFGQDWTGLFIRGDGCFMYASAARVALAKLDELPAGDPQMAMARGMLRGLAEMLEQTRET